MARDLTNDAETASLASHIRLVALVHLDLSSGHVRANSSDRTITYDGADYLGVGDLGRIGTFGETTDLSAEALNLELSGIDPDYIDIAVNEHVQGRPARLWLAFLDSTYVLIADPVLIFRGRIDTMEVELGDTATVRLRVESRLADWDRPRIRRYTHEDQKARFPSDKGLEFVAQTTEREIVWGRA